MKFTWLKAWGWLAPVAVIVLVLNIAIHRWMQFRLWLAHLLDRIDVWSDHRLHPWGCNFVMWVWPSQEQIMHDLPSCSWCGPIAALFDDAIDQHDKDGV